MNEGLVVLFSVFVLTTVLGVPIGLSMLASGFAYFIATGQDVGLVTDQTMSGLYNSYLLIAVPLFIFVANVMNASGVVHRLLTFGSALVGHLPGGLGQVNVVSNLIFSGMSGSAVADASGPGLVIARMMMQGERYPRGFAAATSVAAATLGPLMPTSIALIFYAIVANTSVGAMLLAGIVPALLMALFFMGTVAVIAWSRNFPREIRVPLEELPRVARRALLPLLMPFILLGCIYSGATTPTEAAAIAAAYALFLAFGVYRTMSPRQIFPVVVDTVLATTSIATIMAGAFVFNYAVANENVPQLIRDTLLSWKLSPFGFLMCTNVLMLILAIFLDEVTILLVVVPLLVPIAAGLDINLVHFGVVVILNMMVGLALPPHGLLIFVMNGLTGTPINEIYKEILPFIIAMLLVVFFITAFPVVALWLPASLGLVKS
jgi:C4-dicarboxylate transporter DctM subunit